MLRQYRSYDLDRVDDYVGLGETHKTEEAAGRCGLVDYVCLYACGGRCRGRSTEVLNGFDSRVLLQQTIPSPLRLCFSGGAPSRREGHARHVVGLLMAASDWKNAELRP